MFKTKLHYSIDTEKQIVSLRPTAGTILKAFMPSIVIWGAILGYGSFANLKEKHEENKNLTEDTNEE